MSIGKNIARFRKAKKLKRSELGDLLGVSSQAVSKWENGGAPDVTLLPKIAQALDVSVGMLFGGPAGTWRRQVAAELVGSDPEHATERVCAFLWELQKEMNIALGFSDVLKDVDLVEGAQGQCHVRLCQDSGLWLSNIHPDFHYGLVMPEPAEGFASVLASPEEYERVFAVLGKKDRCRVFMWIYGQDKPVSLGRIGSQLNIPVAEALEDLAALGFVQKLEIDTETGPSLVYGSLPNCSQLPFLYFLREFLHEDEMLYVSATCFLMSALLEVSIQLHETLPQMEKRPHVFREIAGTLRYIVKEQRSIWEIALVALAVNTILGALITLAFPVIVTTTLGFGEAEGSLRFGYMESIMALGALLGSLGAGVFARRFRPRDLMWVLMRIGSPLVTGGLGLMFLPRGLGLYYLLLAAAGVGMFFNGIFNVQVTAYLQMLSPPEQMGKIIGCLSVVTQLGQPVGMLVYGWLMELVGERVGLLFLGSFLVFTLFLLRSRRPFRRLDETIGLAKR